MLVNNLWLEYSGNHTLGYLHDVITRVYNKRREEEYPISVVWPNARVKL